MTIPLIRVVPIPHRHTPLSPSLKFKFVANVQDTGFNRAISGRGVPTHRLYYDDMSNAEFNIGYAKGLAELEKCKLVQHGLFDVYN